MLELLEEIGPKRVRHRESGVIEIDVDLAAALGDGGIVRAALRRAATGALAFLHPLSRA